jgi:hypothetical protein
MAINTTNAVTVNITTTEDTSGAVDINRSIALSYDSNFAELISYQKLLTGATQIPNTIANTYYQVYIKNNDAAAQVQVSVLPTGGALVNMGTLNPQDFILIWQKTAGTANAGYTGITLTVTAASCLVEYFLGG